MRLCADENVTRSVTTLLAEEGYDVVLVRDELGEGATDDRVVRFCRETNRVLLTNDEDFFVVDGHPGILFLDDQRAQPRAVVRAIQRIERFVTELDDHVWHVPDGWI